MTKERINALKANSIDSSPVDDLTDEEYDQGFHFCWDWDGLFITPDSDEFKCCTCHPLNNKDTP